VSCDLPPEKLLTFQVDGHEVEGNAGCGKKGLVNLGDLWVTLTEVSQDGPVGSRLQAQPSLSH